MRFIIGLAAAGVIGASALASFGVTPVLAQQGGSAAQTGSNASDTMGAGSKGMSSKGMSKKGMSGKMKGKRKM